MTEKNIYFFYFSNHGVLLTAVPKSIYTMYTLNECV
jgi:hypothetical protein